MIAKQESESDQKKTKETLAASFRVKETGKYLFARPTSFRPSSLIFRPGKFKGAGLTFVQRGGAEPTFVKGARLATPGERKEIQYLRTTKGGTNFIK